MGGDFKIWIVKILMTESSFHHHLETWVHQLTRTPLRRYDLLCQTLTNALTKTKKNWLEKILWQTRFGSWAVVWRPCLTLHLSFSFPTSWNLFQVSYKVLSKSNWEFSLDRGWTANSFISWVTAYSPSPPRLSQSASEASSTQYNINNRKWQGG